MKKFKRDRYRTQQNLATKWESTASPYLLQKLYNRQKTTIVVQPKPPKPKYSPKRLTKRQRRQEKKRLRLLQRKERALNRPKQMTKYEVYIKSKEWRARCASFYMKYGRKCFACESKQRLHVHHMSYTHMGNELDEELSVLCADCHKEYHRINGTQRDMIIKSLGFIKDKRRSLNLEELPLWS